MKKKDLIKKYDGKLNFNTIIEIYDSDKTKTHKYADYMCYVCYNSMHFHNLSLLITTVNKFDIVKDFLVNKDIYSKEYKDFNYLEEVVDEEYYKYITSKSVKEEEKNIFIIYENDDFILLHPKNHMSAMKYGKDTKWCTAYHYPIHYNKYKPYLAYLISKIKRKSDYNKIGIYKDEMYDQIDVRIDFEYLDYDWTGWSEQEFNLVLKHYNKFKTRKNLFKRYLPNSMYRKLGY